MSDAADWVLTPPEGMADDGRPRLFCLPHAGGDTVEYQPWAQLLAPRAEVLPVVLPGRGKRYREAHATNLRQLTEALVEGLMPLTDAPFAFFGHSLGAVLAFETARELSRRGRPPLLLIASASPPPHRAAERPGDRHLLPDAEFLNAVVEAGGTSPEVLEEPELLRLVLPRLRADYTMAETYRYTGGGPPLPCPVRSYAGRHDGMLRGGALEEWAHVSAQETAPPRMFPGGHFYLEECRPAVLAAIRQDLAAALDSGQR
ncbi:alpha/beta fold hydrolase [Streptomyces sp. NPDC050617]|uniref:thioesterase II family protein n=1 Tax=Streptomyces sp. NPDC050617 TaxID=3154628 RepID=UPI00342F7562